MNSDNGIHALVMPLDAEQSHASGRNGTRQVIPQGRYVVRGLRPGLRRSAAPHGPASPAEPFIAGGVLPDTFGAGQSSQKDETGPSRKTVAAQCTMTSPRELPRERSWNN